MNTLAQVSEAQFTALERRVSGVETRINGAFDLAETVDQDAKRGIAAIADIAAQAAPHYPSEAGKTSYASNIATNRGQLGVSLGVMHRLQGDVAITAGVTDAGGNSTALRAGVAGEF